MNWWLAGGVAAALLLIRKQGQAASAACKPCYDAKSKSYQACSRLIPPENRAERGACFNAADIALQNCLRACGG